MLCGFPVGFHCVGVYYVHSVEYCVRILFHMHFTRMVVLCHVGRMVLLLYGWSLLLLPSLYRTAVLALCLVRTTWALRGLW